jgi:hypothetical protein
VGRAGALDSSAAPRPKGGQTHAPNRATLTGILFVLKSGIPWEFLPPEMDCGSGITCRQVPKRNRRYLSSVRFGRSVITADWQCGRPIFDLPPKAEP